MESSEGKQFFGGEMPSIIAAAHELKSPLVLARQLALEARDTVDLQPEVEQLLTNIVHTNDRALRLATDLTRTSRLNETIVDLEPVNVRQLCEDVVQELSPLFSAHGKQLAVKRQRAAPLVVAHRDLLRRVLLNFSDNALHYANEQSKVMLSIKEQRDKKLVRIAVRDFGPRVPARMWHTLEEAMTRPESIHARPQSSGLGLYIARTFSESMHGTIGAIRHKDGSTFYVDIPASEQLSLL